ncbi:tRNA dihydrouridine synthase DusB [Geotalea sp. SG265]|uniref:tRNA dihydrouridine synthase DusB n=1 Tax=Geotalea sp. SG265 TaxID=2922867 RepID=UPI001FAFAC75|nr:tRNA dihydrouridine synthase DusB [Geotalea sp. SG265]
MNTVLSIGSLQLENNLILAPMAGLTNLPMRILAREAGAALTFTEMVSVNGLVRDGKKTFDLLRRHPGDRPMGVQIFGDDPELLAEGARLVEPHGELIDINMGCPVRKVVGSGAGSALLREPAKVAAIVRAVRKATTLPLTIKIRTGWGTTEHTFLEIGRIAEAEGADAVTLHPRSRAQMFEGHADWSRIEELKDVLAIPVIGSGDIFTAADVVGMIGQTGCDGVMVARGGLGNPWLFREALALMAGEEPVPPTAAEKRLTALRHMELFLENASEHVAVREMRKHLSWYAKGVPGASQFRAGINRIETKAAMIAAIDEFFSEPDHAH